MKKNFLLIATLAGLASIASAASNQPDDICVLPTYVVTAPRELPAERLVNERLQEFRAEARHNFVALPNPGLPKIHTAIRARNAKAPAAKIMAKS